MHEAGRVKKYILFKFLPLLKQIALSFEMNLFFWEKNSK